MNPDRCDCSDALRETHLYIDDALEPDVRAMVEAHLVECPECSKTVTFQATLRSTITRAVVCDPLPDDLVDRLLQRLGEAGPDGPDGDVTAG